MSNRVRETSLSSRTGEQALTFVAGACLIASLIASIFIGEHDLVNAGGPDNTLFSKAITEVSALTSVRVFAVATAFWLLLLRRPWGAASCLVIGVVTVLLYGVGATIAATYRLPTTPIWMQVLSLASSLGLIISGGALLRRRSLPYSSTRRGPL
ncbi:MAG: hypothetical protein M1118_05745 [Chloroflexi bacterium]|nr:hypothetical protein [Chloroflexota bacterium]